jgi:CheY-like chemotaxis protein
MDSKELLVTQYQAHAELLSELLASRSGEPVPGQTLTRSLRGTHMLAGSTAVMGLSHWSELCGAYQSLLNQYRDRNFPWDERIADVTSEMIEKMETVVSTYRQDGSVALDGVVPADEMAALSAELGVLDEECRAMTDVPGAAAVEPAVTVDLEAAAPSPAPAPDPAPAAAPESEDVATPVDSPLPGVVAELRGSFERLEKLLRTNAWKSRSWDTPDVAAIQRELNTIDFCARSMEKVIRDKGAASSANQPCSLAPLRVALHDFAAELGHGSGRSVDVELVGEEFATDPRLLSTTALVLQSMITDIYSRSETETVRIAVTAEDSNGALRWTVRDNGGNFISDSPLDHEDQLAFYRGLRDVINLIARHRSVLWVEPGSEYDGLRSRFEFTLPVNDTGETLVTWGEGPESFALRATQVCAILDAARAGVRDDEYGRYVEIGGGRVPVFQLDELYRSGPGRGDAIVVLGALEKRIAFYVPGTGSRVDAHVLSGAVPPWEGAPPYVAQFGQRRVSLLDADHVLGAYHSVTGTMTNEQISGGVPEDEPEVTPSQAASMVDVPAPPGLPTTGRGEKGIDVLIVEQSESMRDSLTGILGNRNLTATCATGVDEALGIVRSRAPRLVISEFRMPTMAAKRIVDTLKEAGSSIPVLVTTSQSGETADLLVEKLGAAGYLSKPLDPDEVATSVSAHLGQGVAR